MIIVDDLRDVRLFDGLIILNVGGLYGDISMAKKIGYTPISIFAAGCEAIATAAALTNPATAPFAVGIGTAASAVASGIELNDEEKNIKDNLDKAMDKAWATIDKKYRLSLHTEKYTDNCLTELKREVMGENTSVEEFVRNTEIKGFEPSIALVIQGILKKHIVTLNRDPEIIWSDEYTENAAKDMASILVDAIKSVFENVDHLRILKAIYKSEERIVTELHQATNQVIGEIRNVKPIPTEAPLSLTYIPPAINLIGREKDIQGIYDLFEQHNIVFIHADGGVGKTAAAAKIVNQIKDDITSGKGPYKHVAWITSTGDLKSDLTGLNIPLVDTMKTPEEKHQIVSTYLQSNPTFLVIDNMDEPPTREESNELNTLSGQTKILITTRADIPYADEYLLKDLDPDYALVLFYRHFTRKEMTIEQIRDRKDCSFGENIVKAATYNALFIELIGKMAYADHWKLGDLWEKLSEAVFSTDSKHPIYAAHGDDGKLLKHIEKLYKMSRLSERQKEIMSFMALFPVEHSIFFDVFEWAGFENDEEDNLEALQDRGWIVRDEEGYLVHTIVKGSVEKQVGDRGFDEDKQERLIKKLSYTDQYIPKDMVYTKFKERIVVPETICEVLSDYGSERRNTGRLYNNIGAVYVDRGIFNTALKYYEKALEIYKKVLGLEHPDTATIFNNMADAFCELGKYAEAMEYNKNALTIYKQVLGIEHPCTAKTFNSIALVYFYQGKYAEAEECYKKAIAIQEKVLGMKHLDTVLTYNNIALVYRNQAKIVEALKYYGKALEIYKQVLGPEHPLIATTYNGLAVVFSDQGNYLAALQYCEKALVIREKVLGLEHPSTATTYDNIALLYHSLGDYSKAMQNNKKALEIREKVLGIRHPDTARTYNNMALIYSCLGDYGRALTLYERALVIYEHILGVDHPDTATTYSNVGILYANMQDYQKAKEYLERSLTAREKAFGKDHPYTRKIKKALEDVIKKVI